VPKRVLIPGDVQYLDGWSDAVGCGSTRANSNFASGHELPTADVNYCTSSYDGSTTHWVGANHLPGTNATYCPGADGGAAVWGKLASGAGGSCSFAETYAAAANNDAVPGVGDGILAGAGSHDWFDQKSQTGGTNPDLVSGSPPSWCTDMHGPNTGDPQACGWFNEFPVTTPAYAGQNGICNTASCPDTYGDYTDEISGGTSGKLNVIVVDVAACMTSLGAALCQSGGTITNWVKSTLGDATLNPPGDTTVVELYNPIFADFDHGDYYNGTHNGSTNNGFNSDFRPLWHALFPSAAGANGFTVCGGCSAYGQEPDVVLAGHNHGYERLAPVNYAANGIDNSHGIPILTIGTGGQNVAGIAAPQDCTTGTDPNNCDASDTNCTGWSGGCSVLPSSVYTNGYDYWASGAYGTPNNGTTNFGILQLSYTTGASPSWSTKYFAFGTVSGTCTGGGSTGTPQSLCQVDSANGTSHI
jgi:hypothetical protein